VQRYPIAVKNKWVFVWMGEAATADSALLRDNFSCDSPEWDYGDRPGARRHRGGARGIRVTRKVHDVPPPPYHRSVRALSEAIDADPGAPMLLLAMDAAVVRFRKRVAEAIAAERPTAQAAEPAVGSAA